MTQFGVRRNPQENKKLRCHFPFFLQKLTQPLYIFFPVTIETGCLCSLPHLLQKVIRFFFNNALQFSHVSCLEEFRKENWGSIISRLFLRCLLPQTHKILLLVISSPELKLHSWVFCLVWVGGNLILCKKLNYVT